MRRMRNLRTGGLAAYDQDLIDTGRWEEFIEKPSAEETSKPKKKVARVANVKAVGALEVVGAQHASEERQT